jgi:hypothetical protein
MAEASAACTCGTDAFGVRVRFRHPLPRVTRPGSPSGPAILRVYAKCIHGMEKEVPQRIWEATRQ